MGNAAITIYHPTSLKVGPIILESGKLIEAPTGSQIRVEKRDGAAVGCGGVFSFTKIVNNKNLHSGSDLKELKVFLIVTF